MRFLLPFCLLLALFAAPSPARGGQDEAAVDSGDRRKGERLSLALLGMIGSDKPAQVDRGKRLFAVQPDAFTLRPLAVALRCEPARLRTFAAQQLGQHPASAALRPLVHRAVHERTPVVRRALAEALRARKDAGAVPALAGGLAARDPALCARAVDMLGRLGDERAVPHLLARWEATSGDFRRTWFSEVKQVSYVQDMDVEVAKTSFIADPIVGVLQPGVVQDVRVLGTQQAGTIALRRTIRRALVGIAKADHGRTAESWRRWWADRSGR